MNFIQMMFIGLALTVTATLSTAAGDNWMIDFDAAKKKASLENKDLFVDFTGSDWCGWCIKLVDEVFRHDVFNQGVADKFVLVEIDFPRDQSKLSHTIQKQNAQLKEKYDIQGFPTILLMDSTGRPYAQSGYLEGGAEKYLKHLGELQTKRVSRDEAFAKADKLQGLAKAKAMIQALKEVPEDQLEHYQVTFGEISKLDPEDELGFIREQKFKAAYIKFMSSLREGSADEALAKIDEFIKEYKPEGKQLAEIESIKLQIQVGNLIDSRNLDGVIALIDKYIIDKKLEGQKLQSVLNLKVNPLMEFGKFDEVGKVIEQMIVAAPGTEEAKFAENFKPLLQKMKEQVASDKTESHSDDGGSGQID